MKKIIVFLIIFVMFTRCSINSERFSEKEIVQLKHKIINSGDEYSYIKLATYYENENIYGETLPFCIIMINRYNYKMGYDKVLEEIIKINNKGKYDIDFLNNLNVGDRNFALYYLNKGLKENNIECVFLLEKIYRNGLGIPKDLIKADSLKQIYNNKIQGKFK